MNYIDIIIICIVFYFALRGFYDGFLVSLLKNASFFISWLLSILISPILSKFLFNNTSFSNQLLYYTEGAELINNVESSKLLVSNISSNQINEIMLNATVPAPIDNLIQKNIASEAFSPSFSTVGEYFNKTIVNFSINLISFLLIIALMYIVLNILIKMVDTTSPLPVASKFDKSLGSVFGMLLGVFFIYFIFTLLPLVNVVFSNITLPISSDFESSKLVQFFSSSNFLLAMIKGT